MNTREIYIMAQALHVAIKAMKKVPAPFTEPGNIAGMERMLSTHFAAFKDIFEDQDKHRAEFLAKQKETVEG